MFMKAYVFTEKGKVELRDVPEVRLTDSAEDRRAVILRPRYVTPCASDVHTVFAGTGPRRENLVLGHEGLGEIVACGADVTEFHKGELVAVSAVMPDVEDGTGHEHSPFSGSKLGRNINGMWSERYYVPEAERNLAHIPEGILPEQAIISTDVMATGFTAAEAAEIKPGQTVVVIGLGAIGLMALAAAKAFGAGRLIAIGSEDRPECTRLAVEYGLDLLISYKDGSVLYERGTKGTACSTDAAEAEGGAGMDETPCAGGPADTCAQGSRGSNPSHKGDCAAETDYRFDAAGGSTDADKAAQAEAYMRAHQGRHPMSNSTKSPAVDRILDLTNSEGADSVIVCGGGHDVLMQASDLVKYGTGIVSNVAYFEGTGTVELPIFSLGRGMAGKTFKFEFCRGGRHRLEAMMRRIAEKKLADPGRLVTHRLKGSENIPKALRMMKEKPDGLIKVMVEIDGWQE